MRYYKMKFILKIVVSASLLLQLMSCFSNKKDITHLSSKHFTENNINDLNFILKTFENEICSKGNLESGKINLCYKKIFSEIENELSQGNMKSLISRETLNSILLRIDEDSYKLLWENIEVYTTYKDTLRIVRYNSSGRYFEFLKELGYKSDIVNSYHDRIVEWGEMPPSLIFDVANRQGEPDLNDINMRLFISVHYITLALKE